jgi:hypothetical protein
MARLPKGMNEYYGRNVDKMPGLLRAGEVPMYVARLMKERLSQGDKFPDLWSYADTSDLPVYPQSEKFGDDVYTFLTVNTQGQIANEQARQALELITSDNLAGNYGAVVPDEMFEELRDKGDKIGLIKIPRKRITTETYLTKDKVLNGLSWRVLARNPDEVPAEYAEAQELLREYFDAVSSRTKQDKNMAIYVGDSLKDKTTLKAWVVGRADRDGRSGAGARLNLVNWYGRLVGLAPEVLVARNLQGSLVDNANKQLESLEGIVKPENLTEIRKALNERDNLRERLLTAGKIYEAIQEYVSPANQSEVKKILDALTKR